MPQNGPDVMVYDAYLRPQYPMHGYESIEVKVNMVGVGVATLVIRGDHPRRSDLHIAGRRCVITAPDGSHILSGPVTRVSSSSPARASDVTVTIEDDARVFAEVLGWVNPAAGPSAQAWDNQDTNWRWTAPAETAFKQIVSQNFTRLGLPYRVVPTAGRGKVVSLRSRMHKIADVIYPTVTDAGVIPVVRQQRHTDGGQEVVVDVIVPVTRPPILTLKSPQITAWSYEQAAPGAFGGVAGGSGEGTARTFVQWEDTTLRKAWGPYWGGEFFDDQRQESRADSLTTALQEQIRAVGPATAMSVSLEDTDTWRYGSAWRLGDSIRVRLVDTAPVQTIQVTEVTHSHDKDKGYRVVSTCSPPAAVRTTRDAVYQLARRIRHLETGR